MKTRGFFIRVRLVYGTKPVYGIGIGLNPVKAVFLYGVKPVYGLMFGLIKRVLTETLRSFNRNPTETVRSPNRTLTEFGSVTDRVFNRALTVIDRMAFPYKGFHLKGCACCGGRM